MKRMEICPTCDCAHSKKTPHGTGASAIDIKERFRTEIAMQHEGHRMHEKRPDICRACKVLSP